MTLALCLSLPNAFSATSTHHQHTYRHSAHSRHHYYYASANSHKIAVKRIPLNSAAPVSKLSAEAETDKLQTAEVIQPRNPNSLWAVMHNQHGEPIYLMPRQDQQVMPALVNKKMDKNEPVNALFQADGIHHDVVDVPNHKTSAQSEAWNKLLETACTAHNNGDYVKAKSTLEQALPLTDDELEQATLHAAIGEINWESHQGQEALKSYRKAAELVPEQFQLRYAQLLVLTGQRNQAISLLESATDETIPRAQQTFLLGTLHEELGEYDQALKYLNEAARLQPYSADVLYNLGLTCELTGQTDKAHQEYQRALKIEPGDRELQKAFERTIPQSKAELP